MERNNTELSFIKLEWI